ncbi:MAG: AmmeMemoRadiSam system protein B [Acidobacteria bacterium]|nr:AmmeMemoRadiSam system protein B [Acidobacteriota bacterium]
METSSVVFIGIAPHPPIMVPEVGGVMTKEVRGSIDGMHELTRRIIASGAQTVILISPHAPLEAHAFVAYNEPHLQGSFANFRAPQTLVNAPLDTELLKTITGDSAVAGYVVTPLACSELDHGITVPLYFLQRNGWSGRIVALGYSFLPDEDHLRFGMCVKSAVDSVGRPVAFIASGDLSHRLKPTAPAGYNPEAHFFDEEVVAAIKECAPDRIINVDQNLRRIAGECGYRSILVALGVSEGVRPDCELLHYEAPFGVGYLVAQVARNVGR